MSARTWIVPAVILVAAAVLAVAVGGSNGTSGTATPQAGATPTATSTSSPQQTAAGPSDFTTFRSEQAGLEISYPADWDALNSPDDEVVLIATPNGSDSLLVRVVDLDAEVGPDDLPQMQQVTDRIVRSGEGVEVLVGPREITVSGLPGYYYLYRFVDDATGQQGAHAHYFLFDGSRMIVLVFQALPDERFEDLADIFDRITGSLRILSR